MSENADQSTTAEDLHPYPTAVDHVVASGEAPDPETSRDPVDTLRMKRTLHAFLHRLRG
jgi:hypothetical protein